jgi:hypothetical protein
MYYILNLLKNHRKALIFLNLLDLNLNLSFRIILIQKYEISSFGKYLNMFVFKSVFSLNLNFEFKSNLLKKNFKAFSIFLQRANSNSA